MLNSYKPYHRYEKLKIYTLSTNEMFESFDEFFSSEYFKDRFYDTLNSSYTASDVIHLSSEQIDEIFQSTVEDTISVLVEYEHIYIIKE